MLLQRAILAPMEGFRPQAPEIVALFGPTGVGKTAIALALADLLRERGEDPVAVSADAMQVYAGLEVLSGAASAPERAALEHRLVSFVDVAQTFSVGEYAALAHAEIDGLLAAGRRPIVVGGTGLYLRAALAELDLLPPPRAGVRARLTARLASDGAEALHARLNATAPWAAAGIAPTDGRRIVRALGTLDAGVARPRLADPRARGAPGRGHAGARATALRGTCRRARGRRAAARAPAGRRSRRGAADLQPGRLRGRAVGQRLARGDPVLAPTRLDRRR